MFNYAYSASSAD